MELSGQQKQAFLEVLWDYYAHHARHNLPWRQPDVDGKFDPYKIMVSELMLQQTQVPRVVTKYHEFLAAFPTVHELATAELGDVLRAWQGLGYNRRAKFLWQTAQIVDNDKRFPNDLAGLVKLPGIGPNTAGAILAYAFNLPATFIETNVRTVYIHHFFASRTEVTDSEIKTVLEQMLAHEEPREFYWALMDYGSYLKATVGNANSASKHYVKQSKFQGSQRQIRGQVIRLLGERPYSTVELTTKITDERLPAVLAELIAEQLVRVSGSKYSL